MGGRGEKNLEIQIWEACRDFYYYFSLFFFSFLFLVPVAPNPRTRTARDEWASGGEKGETILNLLTINHAFEAYSCGSGVGINTRDWIPSGDCVGTWESARLNTFNMHSCAKGIYNIAERTPSRDGRDVEIVSSTCSIFIRFSVLRIKYKIHCEKNHATIRRRCNISIFFALFRRHTPWIRVRNTRECGRNKCLRAITYSKVRRKSIGCHKNIVCTWRRGDKSKRRFR